MPLTTAYAGHADITSENAGAILNQFLPQDPPEGIGLGLVFIPERVPRVQKGLKTTIAWLETELGGSDATIPVPDLIQAMLDRAKAEGDDLELYLLFDPKNEDDVALANAANDAGIAVRNLAAAGDFLVFEEAEPETPPFDVDEPTAEQQAMAAEARAEGVLAGEQAAADVRSRMLAQQLGSTGPGVRISFDLSPDAIDAIAAAIVRQMANLGAAQVQAQANGKAVPPAPPAPAVADRPAEGLPGSAESFPGAVAIYYHAEKGTYRKARGMTRDGEVKRYLTEAAAAAGLALPAPK